MGLFYFQEDFDASLPFAFTDPNAQALVGGNFTAQNPFLFPVGTGFGGGDQVISEDNTNKAIFFDVTWGIAEDWRLNLGGRFYDEEKSDSELKFYFDNASGRSTVAQWRYVHATDLPTRQPD